MNIEIREILWRKPVDMRLILDGSILCRVQDVPARGRGSVD